MLNVDTIEQVFKKLYNCFGNIQNSFETVSLTNAVGRYVQSDIFSDIDLPQFKRSVVDGYAVKARDTFGVSESMPVFLNVVGQVEMGRQYIGTLSQNEAIYVPTGGIIPNGADAVVMIEYVEKLDDLTVAVYKPVAPNGGIINVGDDFKKEQLILKKGTKISVKDIGVLAATGNATLNVFKKPTISIISTGDELVDINKTPKLGQVRDINTYAIATMCEEMGCVVLEKAIVLDDFDKFKYAVNEQAEKSDIVIISGSSSAGEKDMTALVLDNILTHGIAIKPGKPTVIAEVNKKPVFGLPGHPISAIVVFRAIVAPFILKQYFNAKPKYATVVAKITQNIHSGFGLLAYRFVQLEKTESGYNAIPIFAKSGAISQIMKADGIVEISSSKEGVVAGENVEVILL